MLGMWAREQMADRSRTAPTRPSLVPFSTYSTSYMGDSTADYKIGFLLDDCAQRQSGVSILSTYKVGRLLCDAGQVY